MTDSPSLPGVYEIFQTTYIQLAEKYKDGKDIIEINYTLEKLYLEINWQ